MENTNNYVGQAIAPPPLHEKRRNIVMLVVIVIISLVVLATVIYSALSIFKTGKYTFSDNSLSVFYTDDSKTLFVFNGKKTVSVDGIINVYDSDIHHTVALYADIERTLHVITKEGPKTVSNDVLKYSMDINGNKIYYVNGNGDLHRYNIETGKSSLIDTGLEENSSVVVSPTGRSVAYNKNYSETYVSKNGNKGKLATEEPAIPSAVSDNGKMLYYISVDLDMVLNFKVMKNGAMTELINNIEITENSYITFNKDLTEVIFVNENDVYISRNGKTPEKVCSGDSVAVLLPRNAADAYSKNSISVVGSFLGQVLRIGNDDSFRLITVNKNLDVSDIIYSSGNVSISGDGKKVYDLIGGTLMTTKVSVPEKEETIATSVSEYVITTNGIVYYIKTDGSLWNYQNGQNKKIASACNDYVVSRDNGIYFTGAMADDETLYYSISGSEPKKVENGKTITNLYENNGCISFVSNTDNTAKSAYVANGIKTVKISENIMY